MTIKITKDMERVLRLSDIPAVEALRKEMEAEPDLKWEVERIASLAAGVDIEVLRFDTKIAKNNRIWNFYSGTDTEHPTEDIDVWIDVYAYDPYYGFFDVGAYLSDIWSLTSNNAEEIKSHMYIRHFVEKK